MALLRFVGFKRLLGFLWGLFGVCRASRQPSELAEGYRNGGSKLGPKLKRPRIHLSRPGVVGFGSRVQGLGFLGFRVRVV